jgi:hypothetical protein
MTIKQLKELIADMDDDAQVLSQTDSLEYVYAVKVVGHPNLTYDNLPDGFYETIDDSKLDGWDGGGTVEIHKDFTVLDGDELFEETTQAIIFCAE